jgi:hypothetical protein
MTDRLFMETTRVSAETTSSQIVALLGRAGAFSVLINYEGGKVTAISFRLQVGNNALPFLLPVRTEAVLRMMSRRNKQLGLTDDARAKAERVAWRQAFRWLQAQLAFCETGMVKMEEVFFPYLQVDDGSTVYEALSARGFKMLPEPPKRGPADGR